MEQKVIVLQCRTDIRDEPAQPGPSMTLFDGLFLKCVKRYELLYNTVVSLKIVVSNFYRDFFISSKAIAFFATTDFCHFYIHLAA